MARRKRPARQRRPHGTIEPRGEGRWLIRLPAGVDPASGKRLRYTKTVDGTRADAELALRELLGQRDRGVPLPRSRMTLHEWLEEFDRVWSGHLAPQTREKGRQALRIYVPPSIQGRPLQQLTPQLFQAHYGTLSATLSPSTVGRVHRELKARLNRAVALGHLAVNPLTAVKPPAKRRREYRVFTPAEARVFLEEAEADPRGALWTLLLLTGLRPEEALGLKWEDLAIDKRGDRAQLRIRRALVRVKRTWTLAPTKTDRERSVPLSSLAVAVLKRHRATQGLVRLQLGSEYAGHGLIFATLAGAPLTWHTTVSRSFWPLMARVAFRLQGKPIPTVARKGLRSKAFRQASKTIEAARAAALVATGLDRMRPYDLRHSAATLLLAAGEHPKVVQEILGHASITLTLDTYSHVIPGLQERAADRLEEIIGHRAWSENA